MKICMSFGAGGHLDETMMIIEAFKGHDIFFVVTKNESTKELRHIGKVYFIKNGPKPVTSFMFITYLKLVIYYLYLLYPSLHILLKERPRIIFGNGGEATLALTFFGKLLNCKVIYLESLARVEDLSGTGKLIYNIVDLFLVQWKDLLLKYKKARYWGRVI